MRITNLGSSQNASFYVACELYHQMLKHPHSVLGLATGGTMVDMYGDLVRLLRKNKLEVSHIETFNLDEYKGVPANHPESYNYYMHHILFDRYPHFSESQLHLPNGMATDVVAESKRYENLLDEKGPVDIQILGIGENGHIGFNEPGTPFESTTHCVNLTESTIQANSRFFENEEDVPRQAISMGLQSIMKAKRIILLAFGQQKKDAITHLAKGEITPDMPASILRSHPHVDIYVDDEAMPDCMR
ncbi:glucosamine-6-phosphate deaminase [Staphylococcus felis]|uniref:glucosamine-6-phosphate deaminase n=1 Tax=Staphylococcus felis TaxID=46127 RepID=UPI000E240091|nr:glucosamine-6-phosphate deaminase [Staphylococcus felis]REH78717.1 glucosamine-6-phosphate deaminase [Staphylococcus felis]REI17663.1 glucosamine-6-phosphate deaminase [Staphylococcus felis]